MHQEKEIKFVADRYRPGRFNANRGWSRLGIAPSLKWRRYRIAAAIAGVVFLSASAAFVYDKFQSSANRDVEIIGNEQIFESPALAVKVIDFENTPLPVVIERINDTYGVKVTNIPDDADDYRLSLHYEGNAIDLVETINDILDTQMRVEE